MTEPRYTKVISLKKEDYDRVEKLVKRGFKVVDIFRAGVAVKEKES